jgi:membrane fusion protein
MFRKEVLDARENQWLGKVRLALSIPAWLTTLAVVLIAGALVAYVTIGSYAKKARVAGLVVPDRGEVNVLSPIAGRVVEQRVREGDTVAEGDVLFVVNVDRISLGAEGTARSITDNVAQQIETRKGALRLERELRLSQNALKNQTASARATALDIEIRKAQDGIQLQIRRRDLATKSLQRYEELGASQFVSPIQVQQQQENLLEQDGRLQTLERELLALQRERMAVLAEQRQINAQLASELNSIDRDLAGNAQEAVENDGRRSTLVTATQSGIVTAVNAFVGQSIASAQSLAAIVPAGAQLQAEIYAPSRTVGFVESEQPVQIRYAAYPYQKFGLQIGKVESVSRSAIAVTDLAPALQVLFGKSSSAEPLYRITVKLQRQDIDAFGKRYQLRPGMALEADVVQEHRRIIEWMLEPLLATWKRGEVS